LPYNVAMNCVLTAPLCHVDIVRLLCSELSLLYSVHCYCMRAEYFSIRIKIIIVKIGD